MKKTAVLLILGMCVAAGCAFLQSAGDSTVDIVASAARRQAVLVALGNVDPGAYGNWNGDCPGADVDLANAKRCFPQYGSTVIAALWNQQATSYRIFAAWVAATRAVAAAGGGTVDLYFSGHGGQEIDLSGDESDKKDETLCAWDGQITDDLIGAFLAGVPQTVQVNFWTDCCNSGSNYRPAFSLRRVMHARTSRAEQPIMCRVAHLGGCRDGAVSLGSLNGGELSNAIWKTLKPGMTWRQLRDACDKIMPREQIPVLEFVNMDETAEVLP